MFIVHRYNLILGFFLLFSLFSLHQPRVQQRDYECSRLKPNQIILSYSYYQLSSQYSVQSSYNNLYNFRRRNPIKQYSNNIFLLCSAQSCLPPMEMIVPPTVNLPLDQETPGTITHVDLGSGAFWFRPDILLSRIEEIEQTLESLLSGVNAG